MGAGTVVCCVTGAGAGDMDRVTECPPHPPRAGREQLAGCGHGEEQWVLSGWARCRPRAPLLSLLVGLSGVLGKRIAVRAPPFRRRLHRPAALRGAGSLLVVERLLPRWGCLTRCLLGLRSSGLSPGRPHSLRSVPRGAGFGLFRPPRPWLSPSSQCLAPPSQALA